jgi:hypothetical protein
MTIALISCREGTMADYIYVDNTNLFIEGRRVAAVKG